MGSVRSKYIKRAAQEFIEKYPGKFTQDFTENTKVLDGIMKLESKTTRNRVAGYITTILNHPKG